MLDDYTMKAFQKVLCGLVLGSLALGAGAVALSHKVSSKGNIAHAAVVDAEPTWDFHLEEAKIKGYTEHHFETMVGHDGVTETTAYVFSAEGNCSANPEVRFVTPTTQTVTKPYTLVATETPVISVNFWYKLSNSSEKNVGDVAWSIIKTSSESPAYFTIDDLMARGLVYLCCKRILIITTRASER